MILTDKDIFYKDSVVFPKNTAIPKDADFVKVYPDVSEDFLNEIQKHYPYKNIMHIGMGIEKYYGIRVYMKEAF